MARPKKLIPTDRLKELIGERVIVTSSDGQEIRGELVSVDQCNLFVTVDDQKRGLRLEQVGDVKQEPKE